MWSYNEMWVCNTTGKMRCRSRIKWRACTHPGVTQCLIFKFKFSILPIVDIKMKVMMRKRPWFPDHMMPAVRFRNSIAYACAVHIIVFCLHVCKNKTSRWKRNHAVFIIPALSHSFPLLQTMYCHWGVLVFTLTPKKLKKKVCLVWQVWESS